MQEIHDQIHIHQTCDDFNRNYFRQHKKDPPYCDQRSGLFERLIDKIDQRKLGFFIRHWDLQENDDGYRQLEIVDFDDSPKSLRRQAKKQSETRIQIEEIKRFKAKIPEELLIEIIIMLTSQSSKKKSLTKTFEIKVCCSQHFKGDEVKSIYDSEPHISYYIDNKHHAKLKEQPIECTDFNLDTILHKDCPHENQTTIKILRLLHSLDPDPKSRSVTKTNLDGKEPPKWFEAKNMLAFARYAMTDLSQFKGHDVTIIS